MEQSQKRVCKRCFLEDIASKEYLENMRAYIKGLDEDIKASEKLYRDRLFICGEGDELMEGICRSCGCFVEYRAAIRIKNCPGLNPRW